MSLEQSFSNTFEDDTGSLAGGLSSVAAPAPAPTAVASLPSYENAYAALGGKEATDNLAAQFRSMGMSEDAIGSVFSPYYQTPMVDTAPVQNTTADTTAQDYWNQQAAAQQAEWERQADANRTLSGNILAGASWHSINPTLADELTQYTGQPTLNTAVGGASTADTLKQLDDFIGAGGSFAPGANVFLQQGGLDFINGVDPNVTQNNLDQILSKLGGYGANVILSGSPYAASFNDVVSNNFSPELHSMYGALASNRPNVSLVDSMGRILQDKSLLADPIHPNAQGWQMYNRSVIEALNALNSRNRTTEQG
jgi:hypothetical protein